MRRAVPNAKVTVESPKVAAQTGCRDQGESGEARFTGLAPGPYRVNILAKWAMTS